MSTGRSLRPAFVLHVALVSLLGLGVLVAALLRLDQARASLTVTTGLLAVLLLLADLRPIAVARRGGIDSLSLGGAFGCALLLSGDWSLAVLVQVGASMADDARDRVAWWKGAFNAGQHAVALGAAAAVLALFGGVTPDALSDPLVLATAVAACAVFFTLNHVLIGTAFALHEREPLLRSLVDDLPFHASVSGTVTAMAPLLAAVAHDNVWFVALLLLPVVAVHRGALSALERDRIALHDALTGLPNQLAFRQRLADELSDAGPDTHLGVLVLGLDHFDDVEHTLGHVAADELLVQVAQRLRDAVPSTAFVAHREGGSFLVGLPGLATPWDASSCGETLLAQFSDPYAFAESAFALRASIGLTVSPLHGRDADHLVQHAGVARDRAQRARSGLEVYSAARNDFTERRLTLLRSLVPALRRAQMAVRFQPQVDVATGEVTGYEALLRWEHATLGDVPPDEFVRLAEHAGCMRPITDFVLDEALGRLAEWRGEGSRVTVSVNVSASVLQDADLPVRVARRLALWGVPSSALVLELTETAVMSHPERCREVMRDLRELGVGLSLDDYGTGYASLAYLTTLPVDELKIDRSFVLGMRDSLPNRLVVRSTLDLARELGLRVVAEGVEDAELAHLLAGLGCRTGQGYHYGRAVPGDEVVPVPPRPTTVVLPDQVRS